MSFEIDLVNDKFEALWININNGYDIKLRVGCIYAPQESRNDLQVFKEMYKHIKEHVIEAKTRNERIIILGDFNCKIG